VPVTAVLPGSQMRQVGDRVRMSVDPSHVLVLQE
jgi:hypothetical protein